MQYIMSVNQGCIQGLRDGLSRTEYSELFARFLMQSPPHAPQTSDAGESHRSRDSDPARSAAGLPPRLDIDNSVLAVFLQRYRGIKPPMGI